jgi:hypothetical protein
MTKSTIIGLIILSALSLGTLAAKINLSFIANAHVKAAE